MEINQFIIESAESEHLVRLVADRFQISRQAVLKRIKALIEAGTMERVGSGRSSRYRLRSASNAVFVETDGLQEDKLWRDTFRPFIATVANAQAISAWAYALTEMVNNVIDHSASKHVSVECAVNSLQTSITIVDTGVGVFTKIKEAFGLEDEVEAIQELLKGKLTTDPSRHSGEGIFFSSKLMDSFRLSCGIHSLICENKENKPVAIIEAQARPIKGTVVSMSLRNNTERKLSDLFSEFSEGDGGAFSKTKFFVALLLENNDQLVSRSQAKRLMKRFERFNQVVLDFEGVDSIGQAFAHEVFRVFQNEHPHVRIVPMCMSEQVSAMVNRALQS